MNEPVPNKDQHPDVDAQKMGGQVFKAFHLPWPRKPLPASTKQAVGKAMSRMRQSPGRRSGRGRSGRRSIIEGTIVD